jgi:valyl-tRNA synthetase
MALMAGAAQVQICDTPPGNAVAISLPTATIYLPMASLVDAEKERARLEKERARLEKEIQILDAKLNNPGFTAKAPPALVAAQREKRDTAAGTLQKILAQL